MADLRVSTVGWRRGASDAPGVARRSDSDCVNSASQRLRLTKASLGW